VSRFKVVELEGWRNIMGNGKPPGLSLHILDSHVNYRIVAEWRTEDLGSRTPRDQARVKIRRLAEERLAELEANL
jgi:hypothetical protein